MTLSLVVAISLLSLAAGCVIGFVFGLRWSMVVDDEDRNSLQTEGENDEKLDGALYYGDSDTGWVRYQKGRGSSVFDDRRRP